jgi:hypothetical protein
MPLGSTRFPAARRRLHLPRRGAVTNHAGELRAFNTGGNNWTVAADVDGNGNADLQPSVTVSDAHPLTSGDFTLWVGAGMHCQGR